MGPRGTHMPGAPAASGPGVARLFVHEIGAAHLQHTMKSSGQTSDLFPFSAPWGCLEGYSLCHCDALFSSPVAVSLRNLLGLPVVTLISFQDRAEPSGPCFSWQKPDHTQPPTSSSPLPPLGLRV